MKLKDIHSLIAHGEDSTRQFKTDVRNVDSLAAEMAAFANSEGGTILIGVSDDGSTPGLSQTDIVRINQLISNAASQHVRSPLTVHTENVVLKSGRVVVILSIPKGIDKPYFDKNGVIWLKVGADKRRVNSKEELRRFFQLSDQFYADELPTKAGIDALDKLRFRDFLRDVFNQEFPDDVHERIRLLQNMNLATANAMLNLAGLLLFGEQPERFKPQFIVKAVRYPGNDIHTSDYLDTEDFSGALPKVFNDSLAFVQRNLHKVQAGRGVNSLGVSEIPPLVFEELLVNALVHRDYLISAPIRLFMFDNRIEIVSPGNLPNNLTVEKIRAGNSNTRNPILVSFVSKGLLPYRGLGSGIKRALQEWPAIDLTDDREGCLFTATVHRTLEKSSEKTSESSVKTPENSVKTPEGSEKTPESSVKTPESSEKTPESSEKTSESSEKTPEGSGKTPESSEKTPESSEKTPESSEKSSEKILSLLKSQPELAAKEVAQQLGLSARAVEKQIAKLQDAGRLRRIGPDKGGHWEVIE
jgi:ATP-dependent DNA helicase RecG